MKIYNPDKHHRRTIRLQNYDYSQSGAYFVTICTKERQNLFGKIDNDILTLNSIGEIAETEWHKTSHVRSNVELDEYIIMPNHLHGIILITNESNDTKSETGGLGEIIRAFKTFSARRINNMRKTTGVPLWQRGFYEHIIRNDDDLNRIRDYIINNPLNWTKDEYFT